MELSIASNKRLTENPNNPFVLELDSYLRDINPVNHYLRDTKKYLKVMTGKEDEVIDNFVKKEFGQNGVFELRDPKVLHVSKKDNQDRELMKAGILEYIEDAIKKNRIISPTFTVYENPLVNKSLLSEFQLNNIALRNKAKKEMFNAEVNNQSFLAKVKEQVQLNVKEKNNSVSGAYLSPSQPLFNPTAHSTVASLCKVTSGYGNANNEKFVAGNRHYWNVHTVINNVISISNNTNLELLQLCMETYNLHYPTPEESLQCVLRSSNFYWRDKKANAILLELFTKLSAIERAAFVYVGDLYHLHKYNSDFINKLLLDLSTEQPYKEFEEPRKLMKTYSEDIVHLASQICSRFTADKNINAIPPDKTAIDNIELGILLNTVVCIHELLIKHTLLVRALWVTDNVPSSVSRLPTMVRRVALISDTDSTIFTVQEWVKLVLGKRHPFDTRRNALTATVIFLTSQTIVHVLAKMAKNVGVIKEHISKIAMKNEFMFKVFVPTMLGKHYTALISCREGNVYSKYKEETKGVHLISSKAPKYIMKRAKELRLEIMNTVISSQEINLDEILREIGIMEREIYDLIKKGDTFFFQKAKVKHISAYKQGATGYSPYQHYEFWKDVFGDKYGHTQEPPYDAIKISIDIKNKTEMNDMLDTIKDKTLATNFKNWLVSKNKTVMKTFLIPESLVRTNGIPEELLDIINARAMVVDAMKVFYIMLEPLGVFLMNDKMTRLVSDFQPHITIR